MNKQKGILELVFIVICFGAGLVQSNQTFTLSDDELCNQNGKYYCNITKQCLDTDGDIPCGETCGHDLWGDHYYCKHEGRCLAKYGSVPCNKTCHLLKYCQDSDTCIEEKTTACGGRCSDEHMFLCDHKKSCRSDYYVDNKEYDCADRSDEHLQLRNYTQQYTHTGVELFLQLPRKKDVDGVDGVGCPGKVIPYDLWCRDISCGNLTATDMDLVCRNHSLYKGTQHEKCSGRDEKRLCKEFPGICLNMRYVCDGHVGRKSLDCGRFDYSDEVCQKDHPNFSQSFTQKYFLCKDRLAKIHPALACDGHQHCQDGSDEIYCDCPRSTNMFIFNQV